VAVDVSMDFFDVLVRYETALWSVVEKDLSRAGTVGPGSLQGLRVIDRFAPTCRVNELSRELGITIGAASKFVDRLERGGLAVRTPHPSDRRSSRVNLTSAGEQALSIGVTALENSLSRVLGDAALDDVLNVLLSLQAKLDGLSEHPTHKRHEGRPKVARSAIE
jgi:MarR family multiple antibiotic resistance transcriptional regulator